jgi:aminopeptidase YwaD
MDRSLAPSLVAFVLVALPLRAEAPPLLPAPAAAALAEEISGELAKRNLELIARQHRMRGSRGYAEAAQFVAGELRRYGLSEVEVVAIPADGETFYGTQRSRRPWDADFAELWELRREQPDRAAAADSPAKWTRARRLASWDAVPLSLAQDSDSGDVEADLVDVGAGTAAADYDGREVRGRLVLTSSQPEAVVPLAVERFGAAGIVSYAQNQRTAWWGDDATLVRWGHVGSFNHVPAFAFMVSLSTARDFQARLLRGETVRLHAVVRAGQHRGAYQVVTAVIPGADPVRRSEELTFSCHLDHPRPGANDNASGCAAILEVARAVSNLLAEGRLPRPARTLRFVFPPEVEGTLALLHHRPEIASRARVAIHLDMVGGGPATKAVFHVTRGPASLPSFVHDVAAALGAWANRETGAFAAHGSAEWPLVAAEGGKEPLRAELSDYTGGSDHDVWNEGSFRVPAIYFNDWPDRYIHTTGDTAANIDPTKLERAAFLAAASALVLADLDADRAAAVEPLLRAASLRRLATLVERRAGLPADEGAVLARFWSWHEREVHASLGRFVGGGAAPAAASSADGAQLLAEWERLLGGVTEAPPPVGDGALVFRRQREPRGPMSVFGYDYLQAHLGAEKHAALALLAAEPRWGEGDYAYEALNLVDGRRSAQEIRDALTAVYGPVPLAAVVEYLRALEAVGVLVKESAG